MHFFLLLLIPAAIFCLISTDSKYSFKQLSVPSFAGLFTGIISSAFIEFFVNPEATPVDSFLSIFLPMLKHTAIPSIFLSALFIFFSKDTIEYKSYSILPLLGMFYTIHLPHETFTQGEANSFFMIFTNPFLLIETIILFTCTIKWEIIEFNAKKTLNLILAAFASILSLMIQPALYSLWYLDILTPAVYAITIILLPVSIFIHKFSCKQ